MDSFSKNVLFIDLDKEATEMKTFPDLKKYFGGFAMNLRLMEQYQEIDPIILSVGPLNGFFPYISKTAVLFYDDGIIKDIYLGGHLSSRIKFAGLDAVVIFGKSKNDVILDIENESVSFKKTIDGFTSIGLPGKKSAVIVENKKIVIDYYFGEPENFLAKRFYQKKITGLVITGTKIFKPLDMEKYENIYKNLLEKTQKLSVEKAFFPSCGGCPMGCEQSKLGENAGNTLLNSLVACRFAENIYTDVGTIFSCLNSLGYDYTHEDIEAIPLLIKNSLKRMS